MASRLERSRGPLTAAFACALALPTLASIARGELSSTPHWIAAACLCAALPAALAALAGARTSGSPASWLRRALAAPVAALLGAAFAAGSLLAVLEAALGPHDQGPLAAFALAVILSAAGSATMFLLASRMPPRRLLARLAQATCLAGTLELAVGAVALSWIRAHPSGAFPGLGAYAAMVLGSILLLCGAGFALSSLWLANAPAAVEPLR